MACVRSKRSTSANALVQQLGFSAGEDPEALGIDQIQTAIRVRKPSTEKLNLDDFAWEPDDGGRSQAVVCPYAQRAEVTPGRKEDRYRAAFDAAGCEGCPFLDSCPTESLKLTPERVLRFSQQEVDLALRRQRSAEARASGQKPTPSGRSHGSLCQTSLWKW